MRRWVLLGGLLAVASLALPAAAEAGKRNVRLKVPSAGDIAIAKLKFTAKARPGARIPRKPKLRLKIRGQKTSDRAGGARRAPLPDSLTAVVRKRIVKRTAKKVKIELYTVLANGPAARAGTSGGAEAAGIFLPADFGVDPQWKRTIARLGVVKQWSDMLEKRQQSCGKGLKNLFKAPKKTGSLLDGNPSFGTARATSDWALFDACPVTADVEDFKGRSCSSRG